MLSNKIITKITLQVTLNISFISRLRPRRVEEFRPRNLNQTISSNPMIIRPALYNLFTTSSTQKEVHLKVCIYDNSLGLYCVTHVLYNDREYVKNRYLLCFLTENMRIHLMLLNNTSSCLKPCKKKSMPFPSKFLFYISKMLRLFTGRWDETLK